MHHAAVIGCAMMTGVGAVKNTAGVKAGESVAVILSKPMCFCARFSASIAVAPSVVGSVKVMSVRPVPMFETFCTTMSMLISASARTRKILPETPGVARHRAGRTIPFRNQPGGRQR